MRTIFILFFVSTALFCHAQQDSIIPFDQAYKRVYNIQRLSDVKLTIDGNLDEDLWTDPEGWSIDFLQAVPRERLVPASQTKAKLFYDDKYIYVGIYCKEVQPENLNRFISNRDDNTIGDLVAVALDTYHDYRAAVEFNVNLGGNKTDLIVTDDLVLHLSWNAVWEGKSRLNLPDSSWTVEMRIPFSQLRYNYKSEEGIWGINIRRNIRYSNEMQKFSLIPRPNNGHVYSFGELHGMKNLPKPRDIEFSPYVMGKYRKDIKIPGSPYQKGNAFGGNAGLDVKVALSDYTLDLAVNPDYGQVELDPSVMNLTALETFYEEKRPFFLEGKHILDFANGSDMMFYTRRIGSSPSYTPHGIDNLNNFSQTKENVPILGALKLTGTNRSGLTLGIVESITARSSARVTRGNQESTEVVEPLTNYTVLRVQKNWKGNSLLGGMLTSVNRALDEPYLEDVLVRNAFTAGLDFTQYFHSRLYYVTLKGMFSSLHGSSSAITQLQRSPVHYYQRESAADYLGVDPTRRSLNGTGGLITIGRKGNEKWSFAETFRWSSPGFDMNDVGYMRSTDFMIQKSEISYRQKDIWKMFRRNTLSFAQENHWDYGGRAIHNSVMAQWQSMSLNRYELDVMGKYGWNYLDNRMLRGGPDMRFNPYIYTVSSFNTDKARRLMFKIQFAGDYNIDWQNVSNTLTPSVVLRLGNHLLLSGQFDYMNKKDNIQYVTTATLLNAPEYVMARMKQRTYGLTLKVQANITPDISLQFYGAPFTSSATYEAFKVAADTKADKYESRFYRLAQNDISYAGDTYTVNRPGGNYSFKNPDFNFNEFRSNLVGRWEYRPGSTLYVVWEHTITNRASGYVPGWGDNLNHMFGIPSTNVFMVKMNYWFNL